MSHSKKQGNHRHIISGSLRLILYDDIRLNFTMIYEKCYHDYYLNIGVLKWIYFQGLF